MLRSMDILHFKDLDRLRQTGNFSQAAALSNLSQPAFSRRIKALESWVGATLVDRTRQPVKLTTPGIQMLEAGLQALDRIERERSQILEAQSLPEKYVVAFGAQHSIGWRFYPTWLQSLEDAYGPFLSRLRADDLPGCMRDLSEGSVDFVIAYQSKGNPLAPDGHQPAVHKEKVESVLIGQDRLIPVCKSGADGLPIFRFDTGTIEMPFLRFGDAAPIGRHLEPLLQARALNSRLRTVYENSMAGALRIRARAGDGVAWLPESLISPDIASGELVRTGQADWDVALEIRLYRNKQNTNRITRSLWTFLDVRQSVSFAEVD